LRLARGRPNRLTTISKLQFDDTAWGGEEDGKGIGPFLSEGGGEIRRAQKGLRSFLFRPEGKLNGEKHKGFFTKRKKRGALMGPAYRAASGGEVLPARGRGFSWIWRGKSAVSYTVLACSIKEWTFGLTEGEEREFDRSQRGKFEKLRLRRTS